MLHRKKTASEVLPSPLLSSAKNTSTNNKVKLLEQVTNKFKNNRFKIVVSHNTIYLPDAGKTANEQIDFRTLNLLFFAHLQIKYLIVSCKAFVKVSICIKVAVEIFQLKFWRNVT